MQLNKKSGIYLSCGVKAVSVIEKVRNIPELWRYSLYAAIEKVMNIPE